MLQSQNKLTKMEISIVESGIFDDIAEIEYGELYDIELVESETLTRKSLTPRQLSFIKTLRREKTFFKVIIHDSEPQYAVVDGETFNGRPCQKKFKF